ncbi:MAG: TIGR00341 family protein [Bacteroidetes bacterium]|nr:TIGR00341 family protein [Bacteroidota bacterium]
MKYRLIFDASEQELVDNKLMPLVEEIIEEAVVFEPEIINQCKAGQQLLLFISDQQLKTILPALIEKEMTIAVLPHPDSVDSCTGFGVSRQLDKAVSHLKNEPERLKTDVLYCNEKIVLNYVTVGENFVTNAKLPTVGKVFSLKLRQLKRLLTIEPFLLDISLTDSKVLKTAAAGISVSEHRKSSLLSRMVMEDSSVSDKKMHIFLISPRSIMEMIRYTVGSMKSKSKLPPFAAHIKTASATLSFPDGDRVYVVDGKPFKADKLSLGIGEKPIHIIPGSYLELPGKSTGSEEIFKIAALPDQATAKEIAGKKLPLIKHASTEEFKDLFQVLRDNARIKSSYLVLMVLSTLLATFGLFANSSPVVIGAMILAPLMSPIISLSMGALRQDKRLILNSSTTILAGLGIALFFAVLLTWFTPLSSPSEEILSRTRPNLLDLGIAVISGVAGAYAHARDEIAKTLAGVAIAVALVPPLAVAAIGLGWLNFEIFFGALLLLVTNLAGIVLAASFTFLLLGFSPFKLATKGMLISLVVVVVLSIPLAFSFGRMLQIHTVTKELTGYETDIARITDVRVMHIKPLKISLKLVADEPLNGDQIDAVKAQIEEKMDQPVELEIVLALKR